MKLSIFAVLVLCIFQVNLAVADQYVYADDSVDLDEPIVALTSNTFNAEPYVYADDDVDLDEPTSAVTSNNGSADEKRVSSTNQLSETAL
jgi:hypothetical protein